MEILTQKIKNKFGEKYSYLKLYEVNFDKQKKHVEIIFLYPENIETMSEEDKKQISDFLKQCLNLNSDLYVKFKKSYLDADLIMSSLLNYIKSNHSSVYTFLNEDKINIRREGFWIEISFVLNEELYELYSNKNLEEEIRKFLEKNFLCDFTVKIDKIQENINTEGILEKQNKLTYDKVSVMPKIPRYRVSDVDNIFGHDIEPLPEFIKNIKFEKSSVILAGRIEDFEKKSYESKKGKSKGKTKFYYAFVLNDTTAKIEVRYFTTKANEVKMDKLFNGGEVIIVGDVREFNKKFTLYVNSISYCKLPEIIEYKSEFSDGYEVVKPKPYSIVKQENIFVKEKPLPREVLETEYVVFDTETTGLDGDVDEIIEIGAVKIKNGVICEQFQTLIKPQRPIPEEATKINNISNEMVSDAPTGDVAIRDFYRWTRGATLVAYNIQFDQKFINNAGKKEGLTFDNPGIDCLVIARNKLRLPKYRLSDVVKRLDITLNNAHRALADAIATAEAFLILMRS